jgi:hypothetical protein
MERELWNESFRVASDALLRIERRQETTAPELDDEMRKNLEALGYVNP